MSAVRSFLLVAAALASLGALAFLSRERPAAPEAAPPEARPIGKPAETGPRPQEQMDAWVATSPDAACAWVLGRPAGDRLDAATTLLIAAADHPGLAARLAARLCAEDTTFVRDHGDTLVTVLGAQGRFDAALAFARMGGPEHSEWLQRVLTDWARQDPRAAVRAALDQPEDEGLPQVAAVWAAHDPAALADFAMDSLRGPARTQALTAALPVWIERQPAAVAAWLDRFGPNQEFDSSFAALALLPVMVARYPDVALDWAGLIVDPEIRRHTQSALVLQWARNDPAAVQRHLDSAPNLSDDDRTRLLASLHRPPD